MQGFQVMARKLLTDFSTDELCCDLDILPLEAKVIRDNLHIASYSPTYLSLMNAGALTRK